MRTMKLFSVTAGLAFALPNLAAAETVEEQIIRQLQDQGFNQIEVQRTLLGRVRIDATSSNLERELVFNPATGEILRDYWEPLDDSDDESTPRLRDPSASSGGDRDDDDDRGRNASSGSRNSNSGSDDRQDDDDERDDKDDDDDEEEDGDEEEEEEDGDDDDEDDDDDDD